MACDCLTKVLDNPDSTIAEVAQALETTIQHLAAKSGLNLVASKRPDIADKIRERTHIFVQHGFPGDDRPIGSLS